MVHCFVFIGNIPYNATEKQLIEICEEIAPVVSFRCRVILEEMNETTKPLRSLRPFCRNLTLRVFNGLVRDKDTGKPKGYGFCEYFGEDAALSAQRNLKGYLIGGRELRVHLAQHGNKMAQNTADPEARQPLSDSSALPTGSTITGALGGTENRLENQQGPNPLTNYLQKMSKSQLLEIITEIKLMAAHNDPLVRQYLHQNPVLLKAQNQAEVMLGLATPTMMQMANSTQQYPSHIGQTEVPQQPMAAVSVHHRFPAQNSNLVVPQNLIPLFQETSQFSYSRRVGATTPADHLTEVKPLSELHPAKIRKISNFRLH